MFLEDKYILNKLYYGLLSVQGCLYLLFRRGVTPTAMTNHYSWRDECLKLLWPLIEKNLSTRVRKGAREQVEKTGEEKQS